MQSQKLVSNSDALIQCKVVMLGASSAGKTSIIHRLVNQTFEHSIRPTLGAGLSAATVNGVKLNIWDTAGQENYRSLARVYYRDAQCAVIVFDVTNKNSFEDVNYWLGELAACSLQDACLLFIVGNKTDLLEKDEKARQVSQESAKSLAAANRGVYFETSAKNGNGVNELFDTLSKLFIQSKRDPHFIKNGKKSANDGRNDRGDGRVKVTDDRDGDEESECC
ncbi:GTP-binding protein YPT52 [Tritrichomonas foetus]|uniref:GTP-binding protein YPT52 n=1 Tax=Tritrichomonas foetus TaxID=1144522 RepID=A0A1J4KZM7_9EUKA|nr:GTP-binding protein YPT52 [Tritrichomonas foetus]|eukprot:OHT16713.1 GTP-binding protein YPT52 [Tritrichomonas foetus]